MVLLLVLCGKQGDVYLVCKVYCEQAKQNNAHRCGRISSVQWAACLTNCSLSNRQRKKTV